MKYIKEYESIREDIKKGDIIMYDETIPRNFTSIKSFVYLVLKDVPRNKRKIEVYCFGYFQYDAFVLLSDDSYYFEDVRHIIYKMERVRLLTVNEKIKIADNIYLRSVKDDNTGYKKILDTIKERTGIDLTQMKEYIEYIDNVEMKKRTAKYNL